MDSDKKKIIIFASGTKDGGGSGFENLVNATKNRILDADISAVISNHENGGVRKRANRLGIKFIYFPAPWTAENYKKLTVGADLICLSGWLKLVTGLDPKKTINIHPGPLPRFGGPGMYGHHVHEAVMEAYKKGEVTQSGISMHFVTEKYDEGPLFFSQSVPILPDDTLETLAKRINEAEHKWQPIITQKVLSDEISWDGRDPSSLKGAIFK
jgi:folate-dependent phosphoribosylglycinamide formyltransferase PurN